MTAVEYMDEFGTLQCAEFSDVLAAFYFSTTVMDALVTENSRGDEGEADRILQEMRIGA